MAIIKLSQAFKAFANWVSGDVRAYMGNQVPVCVDTVGDVNSNDFEQAWWIYVKSKAVFYRLNLASSASDDGDAVLRDSIGRRYEKQAGTGGAIGGNLGATDNRLLRADGTGGGTAQGSVATLDDSGNLSGVPSITGGANSNSSLTIRSTSGNGTTDFINFLLGNAGATEAARFDTSGRFILGYTSALAFDNAGVIPRLQLVGTDTASSGFAIQRLSADGAGVTFAFVKSRGSPSSPAIVNSGDGVGGFSWRAYDGALPQPVATIAANVDGAPSSGVMPGRLGFFTNPGAGLTERLRIDSNGFSNFLGGSVGRGAPVTKTADFSVAASENNLINNKSGSSCTVTLPSASSFSGREILLKTLQAQTVVSASSNVVPLAGGAAGTAILAATAGRWAKLVSDGTNWVIMAAN